jgi:O-antigen/teichoic acid export membrane protein
VAKIAPRSTAARFISRVWHSAVGWSFAVTALRAGGFLLVLPLALRRLSPDELGLWYLFASIAELGAFAELGLGLIIGRSASYFMAGVERLPAHGLLWSAPSAEMRAPNLAGLAGLLGLARRVYFRLIAPILVVMLTAGLVLVLHKMRAMSGTQSTNLLTYGVFSVATVLSISGGYWPQFLVGIGHVRLGQRALLLGLVLNYAVAAICLLLGVGILSLALGQLVLALANLTFARRQVFAVLPGITSITRLEIRLDELWPAAWRSLLTTLGANMCCQGTLLVCGILSNLATTASYGLSMKLALVVQGFAGVWLLVRLPHIARARAAGDISLAVRLVRGSVARCALTYALGAAGILIVARPLLELMKSRTPLLPPPLLSALLVMIGLDFFVGFHSAVIVSANRFPHLTIYVASGLATIALAFGLGASYGVAGIIAAPILAQLVCAYWWIPRRSWVELNGATVDQLRAQQAAL